MRNNTVKLDTQRDRWQALLGGHTLGKEDGLKYRLMGSQLEYCDNTQDIWQTSLSAMLSDNEGWQLYEPPKPENRVIVIKEDEEFYQIEGFPDLESYYTENDAIRAAMEWIGEKAKRVEISAPEWLHCVSCIAKDSGDQFRLLDALLLEKALLMHWPIEVLEEV